MITAIADIYGSPCKEWGTIRRYPFKHSTNARKYLLNSARELKENMGLRSDTEFPKIFFR